ncbi:glycosyltransferase family 4 protein [Pseudochrobactrum asaccharolyticum]|uniref:Glycosyltransferase involved in cell wall biosynthesis n=1 Tax=Pseudochrobactrum asaccharolyticum TaxID=354351 RepID=A0A366E9E8_9HYPH|nr:glycosyltransferase family 4 protein [Pseudochrobactrum asaccharolyticum]RBO98937.1 glycosyltransferase involved in cell wall biosynthesis [Pseudochrobactrum asaccharolyticum]
MKQKSLRIIHCFRSPVGGVFRHIRDLAAMQNAAGHQVGVICELCEDGALEQAQFASLLPDLALGLHRIPISRKIGLSDIGAILATRKLFKHLQPDIVHGHGAKGGTYARLGTVLAREKRNQISRPLRFYSPHGGSLHFDAASLAGKVMFTAERWQEHVTDGLIFVSAYEENTYRAKVGNPRCTYAVIRNGISKDEFAPVDLAADTADFLFTGMMRDLKGPDLFIRALAELNLAAKAGNRAPITGAMVGDGPQKQQYQALAEQLGLSEHIRFYPAMPIREALILGRIFVLPSRAESLPYIALEVLAAQRSIIATRVGGLAEIFGEDSPALCKPNTAALAARMHEALTDQAGYQASMPDPLLLRSLFSRENMAAAVEQFYRSY